ncbi:MAG: InlB B-repeat-containing protein [Paludibacteraceae bacterium]|nr:InlB B-repeat-containing protein [Paludibacteraceae bacterium]
MKKFLLSLFGLACLGTASADTYMHVDYNGKTDSYNADDVVEVTFEERKKEVPHGVSVSGTHGGYEYVDLGLPSGIMWATYNIGATKPEESGDFFAWGETEPKDVYSHDSYKWFKSYKITKYSVTGTSTHKDYEVDSLTTLLPEDDAAIVNWKGDWRMPSAADFSELLAYTEWEKVSDEDGVFIGRLMTSKINGNTIFFPNGGHQQGDVVYESVTFYLSNELNTKSSSWENVALVVSSTSNSIGYSPRHEGYKIRPVYQGESESEKPQTYMIVHFKRDGSNYEDTKEYLLDDVKDVRFVLGDELSYPVSGEVDGYEYVDLGLPSGTKWATMNIGAKQPDGSGCYYSWGEVRTKEVYSKSEFSISGNYNTLQNDGVLDLNGMLSASYDAANQNWSENWRMPTFDEFDELIENCNWEWTTFNGVVGYKVISKENGKWIFLPASNGQTDKGTISSDVKGFYWTSQMPQRSTTVDKTSFSLVFDEKNMYLQSNYNSSYSGLTVRPVVGKASVTIAKTFSVKFLDMDGALIESQKVDEGNSAVAPEVPVVCGYKFKGWDKSFENVKSDLIVNAVYDELDVEVVNGHEFVDLGLPSGTKWAKYNIGATKSDIFGEGYHWGATEISSNGYFNGIRYIDEAQTKGYLDSNGDLVAAYDIATQLWGENCKMPTKADFEELLAYCDWELTTMYGKKGYKVSSKSSASDGCNYIFFPTMYTTLGMEIGEDFEYLGAYWSSSTDSDRYIYALSATENEVEIVPIVDEGIFWVRPIVGNASETIAKSFSVKFLDMDGALIESQKVDEGNSAVAPEVPVVCGYKFKGWDKSFENVKSDLIVNAVYDELDVEVVNGHEFVDLGLPSGTKWAKYNIGATKSDIFGEGYHWGATEISSNGYFNGIRYIDEAQTKGYLDSNGDLVAAYDIATQLWGENCKMPTKADFEELLAYCDWELTTMYGKKGYKVSSKSSASDGCNYIFFPTMYTTLGMEIGEDFEYLGAYWSSSTDSDRYIYALSATENEVKIVPIVDDGIFWVRPILNQK